MAFTIGGQEYQHAIVNLQSGATGAPYSFQKFKAVKYENGAEKKAVNDHQGQQVAYTIGAQKTDGSVSMLLSEWFNWRTWLRLQAAQQAAQQNRPVGIGQVAFSMTVQYGATLQTLKKDILSGVMVQKEPRDSSDNQDVLVVEIPLFILDIADENGVRFVAYQ